ncbi:MAG: hypothetical protein AB1640_12725 [bacterium]
MKATAAAALVVLAAVLASRGAVAGGFDGTRDLICAPVQIMECEIGEACKQIRAEEIDLASFFRVKFKEKRIVGVRTDGLERSAAFERVGRMDGKLVLQGAESAVEGRKGGIGWTMAISADSGKMVLSVSGDEVGFVIFGPCTCEK